MSHNEASERGWLRIGTEPGQHEHDEHQIGAQPQQQQYQQQRQHPARTTTSDALLRDDSGSSTHSLSPEIEVSRGRPAEYSQLDADLYDGSRASLPIAGGLDLGSGHVPYDSQYHNREAEAYPMQDLGPRHDSKDSKKGSGSREAAASDSTARLDPWGFHIQGWPTNPIRLRRSRWNLIFSIVVECITALTPLFFIVQAIAAITLNGKRVDQNSWGHNIIILSGTYGVTIFPILFAILAGSALASAANYMLEKGSPLLLLEQLMGSYTVARTIKTQWLLKAWNWHSLGLIWLWALSPLGGQGSLRLIKTGYSERMTTSQITYLNTSILSAVQNSAFSSGSGFTFASSAVSTLFTASVVSPDQSLYASVDLWGNVKIPRFSDFANDDERGWVQVPVNSSFTGLLGLPVLKIPARGNSTFNVTSQHFLFDCTQPAEVPLGDLEKDGFVTNETFTTAGNDRLQTFSVQLWRRTDANHSITLDGTFNPPINEPRVVAVLQRLNGKYRISNCSTFFPTFESTVFCTSQTTCNVTTMRNVTENWNNLLASPLDTVPIGPNSATFLAQAWGLTTRSGVSNPTEVFLSTGLSPIIGSAFAKQVDLAEVPAVNFTNRFTTIFNTYYDAGRVPFVQSNPVLQSQTPYPKLLQIGFQGINTTANALNSHAVFVSDPRWVGILLLSSFALMLVSIAGIVLKYSMAGHSMLQNVSLLTLNNPYVPLPYGGSAMDAYKRTSLLSSVVLKMGDVRPHEEVGQIAVATISNGREVGTLNKNRYYF